MTTLTYRISALPQLDGQTGLTFALNDFGEVVEGAVPSTAQQTSVAIDPIVWQNGEVKQLPLPSGDILASPHSINDLGQVVGGSYDVGLIGGVSQVPHNAVLWTAGADFTPLNLGEANWNYGSYVLGGLGGVGAAYANGINNLGQVVGQSTTLSGANEAFLWQNYVTTNLGTLPGVSASDAYSIANAINDKGQVVGASATSTGGVDAVIWQNGTVTDLGVLSNADLSFASAINDSGQVVGAELVNYGTTLSLNSLLPLTWKNGVLSRLALLSGDDAGGANAINAAGTMVGDCYIYTSIGARSGTQHAVMWQNGSVTDLNSLLPADSPWVLVNATGINIQGEIVGDGLYNGIETGFVLTPENLVLASDTVQTALQAYNSGSLTAPVVISDSAANISANCDNLQKLAVVGDITNITATDSGTPTLSATESQWVRDNAVFKDLSGSVQLALTNVDGDFANLTQMQSQPNLASVAFVCNALNVSGALDYIQAWLNGGKVSVTVTLTDPGIPDLPFFDDQVISDAGALALISTDYTVTLLLSGATSTITGVPGHGTSMWFYDTTSKQASVTPSGDGSGFSLTIGTTSYQVTNVDALQFSDFTEIVAQTPGSNGVVTTGNITELYAAVLGRIPDVAGLAYYQGVLKANPTLPLTIFAQSFLASPEYADNPAHDYAPTPAGDAQFVTDSYQNLLGRAPESGAIPYYQNLIDQFTHGLTAGTAAYTAAEALAHATVLTDFSASPEFLSDVQITAANPASPGLHGHWLVLI